MKNKSIRDFKPYIFAEMDGGEGGRCRKYQIDLLAMLARDREFAKKHLEEIDVNDDNSFTDDYKRELKAICFTLKQLGKQGIYCPDKETLIPLVENQFGKSVNWVDREIIKGLIEKIYARDLSDERKTEIEYTFHYQTIWAHWYNILLYEFDIVYDEFSHSYKNALACPDFPTLRKNAKKVIEINKQLERAVENCEKFCEDTVAKASDDDEEFKDFFNDD